MRVITRLCQGRKLTSVPGDSTRTHHGPRQSALVQHPKRSDRGYTRARPVWWHGRRGHRVSQPGATYAHFVDNNRKAVDTMQANLAHCGL